MERLTRAEEEVMQVLWRIGPAFAKDIRQAMPKPRPAITTVSTIVRILEAKGFVDHEVLGRSHRYTARVHKTDYAHRSARRLLKDYFAGSPQALVSSFIERADIDARELEALLALLKQQRKR
ncbi:MAG: BlaI/MecI/CopY family transcriptional regulator [Flavobacteriales bacterium]|jgi:predicted transcriptional regulator|nr:BlaI/MecI/CopY family transcriptional regulator [Flavobacteriales bacterium]MBK7943256.1 BlaI/MecI/CopY family transcriptional regulator [Flavobacteriales bacterium]MBK8947896.1 BlaI/MecI/CopY family transcriptional regulator [Flavobacteriales bacterium]MBK9700055.1 BlaI/MecI/CopY family transcriptional regulator [Flavobacteriales bacterium]